MNYLGINMSNDKHSGIEMKNEWFAKSVNDRINLYHRISQEKKKCSPVIFFPRTHTDPEFTKYKYIVDNNKTIVEFIVEFRKNVTDEYFKTIESQAINFCTTDGIPLQMTQNVGYYHSFKKDNDGFLYIYYTMESFFG